MTRVVFDSFVALLPHGGSAGLEASGEGGLSLRPAEPPRFVPPDVVVEDDDASLGRVILVSAPAAVGKSWFAESLAARTSNIYWELGHYSVGSGFFTGTLTDELGLGGFDKLRSRIQKGEATLVLDAADEALVRAGAANYEASLENLAKLLGPHDVQQPGAIIFGRPETISDTRATLERLGVAVQEVKVAFFTRDQARNLVFSKAKGETAHNVVDELDDFISRFADDVQTALGVSSWSDAESFLGYAPVLDSLAAFYRDESNPIKKLSEIQKADSKEHVWDMLVHIIHYVLTRESDKFAKSFGGGDERKKEFGRGVYTHAAQVELLLAEDPESVQVDFPNDGVDAEWLDELESKVHDQLKDHPFLGDGRASSNPLLRFANLAFRDFAIAWALAHHSADDYAARLLDYWSSPSVNPSPMLSRFVFTESLQPKPVNPAVIALIADSHASAFQRNLLTIEVYPLDGPDSEDFDEGSRLGLEVVMFDRERSVGALSGTIDSTDKLQFGRGLALTLVEAGPVEVVIGSGAQDFAIGPVVGLLTHTFSSESVELRVRPSNAGVSAIIAAGTIQGTTRRIVGSPDSLRVSASSLSFPWTPYGIEADSDKNAIPIGQLSLAGMALRKNVRWMARQSMTGGSLSYPADAMDTILAKDRASRPMFDYCQEIGILTRDKSSYRLSLPGFSAPTVLTNDLSDDPYRQFLSGYVAWQRSRRQIT